jgi:hypothetical protein
MSPKSKEKKSPGSASILDKLKSVFVEEVEGEGGPLQEASSEIGSIGPPTPQIDIGSAEVNFDRIFVEAQIQDPNEFSTPTHVLSLMATFSQLPEAQRKDMVLKTLKTFKVDPAVVVANTKKRISATNGYLKDVQSQVTGTIDQENETIGELEAQIDQHKRNIQQAQSVLEATRKQVQQKLEELEGVVDFLGGK